MRRAFTFDEDLEILCYFLSFCSYRHKFGNSVWKDAILNGVLPHRSWQSIRERYLKHVRPKLSDFGAYGLLPRVQEFVDGQAADEQLIPAQPLPSDEFPATSTVTQDDACIRASSNLDSSQERAADEDVVPASPRVVVQKMRLRNSQVIGNMETSVSRVPETAESEPLNAVNAGSESGREIEVVIPISVMDSGQPLEPLPDTDHQVDTQHSTYETAAENTQVSVADDDGGVDKNEPVVVGCDEMEIVSGVRE
ncbi:unnamed protein product, partial [Notodromas monacha]